MEHALFFVEFRAVFGSNRAEIDSPMYCTKDICENENEEGHWIGMCPLLDYSGPQNLYRYNSSSYFVRISLQRKYIVDSKNILQVK